MDNMYKPTTVTVQQFYDGSKPKLLLDGYEENIDVFVDQALTSHERFKDYDPAKVKEQLVEYFIPLYSQVHFPYGETSMKFSKLGFSHKKRQDFLGPERIETTYICNGLVEK